MASYMELIHKQYPGIPGWFVDAMKQGWPEEQILSHLYDSLEWDETETQEDLAFKAGMLLGIYRGAYKSVHLIL